MDRPVSWFDRPSDMQHPGAHLSKWTLLQRPRDSLGLMMNGTVDLYILVVKLWLQKLTCVLWAFTSKFGPSHFSNRQQSHHRNQKKRTQEFLLNISDTFTPSYGKTGPHFEDILLAMSEFWIIIIVDSEFCWNPTCPAISQLLACGKFGSSYLKFLYPLLPEQGGPEQQSRPCFGGLQWFHWGGSRSPLYQSRPFLRLQDLGSRMVLQSPLN